MTVKCECGKSEMFFKSPRITTFRNKCCKKQEKAPVIEDKKEVEVEVKKEVPVSKPKVKKSRKSKK